MHLDGACITVGACGSMALDTLFLLLGVPVAQLLLKRYESTRSLRGAVTQRPSVARLVATLPEGALSLGR